MEISIVDDAFKSLLEEVLVKMIQEKREMFYDLFVEALEDVAMANAIREGRRDQFVDEDRIMDILEG